MTLIGLELNDAGIMAAAGKPAKLLEVDGSATESPGFALPRKGHLTVGRNAEKKARLFPRQILNRFWDPLNTEPLEQSGSHAPQNHAEIAFHHLARIWEHIQNHGDETVIAVPNFFDRNQLGLILGIAQELSMPVKGFAPLALAASSTAYPRKLLLHIDIHLHRIDINYLKQGDRLSIQDSETSTGRGLLYLYQQWVDAIAHEFVRTTRFDPYHQAASEQELYDRLPGILESLRHHPSVVFEMRGGTHSYGVTLTRDHITQQAEGVYGLIRQMVEKIRNKHAGDESAVVLQLTRRLARLPGCTEALSQTKNAEVVALEPGAGAGGILEVWQQVADQPNTGGVSFSTSRPWQGFLQAHAPVQTMSAPVQTRPTHLLYRNVAYPISGRPLEIGRDLQGRDSGVPIQGNVAGVSRRHCSVQLKGRDVILSDYSTHGTFVDESRVNGTVALKLGSIIRIGTPGETLQLIACLENDET